MPLLQSLYIFYYYYQNKGNNHGAITLLNAPELPEVLKKTNMQNIIKIDRPAKGEIAANWPKDRFIFITDDSLYF